MTVAAEPYTTPADRSGNGTIRQLVSGEERAILPWFEDVGVTDAFTCIEALNAASRNRFAQRGCEPLGFVIDAEDLLWVQRRDGAADDRGIVGGTEAHEDAERS